MADLVRFEEYMNEMAGIQARVGDPVFIRRFELQLFELLSSGQIRDDEVGLILQELESLFTVEFSTYEQAIKSEYDTILSMVNDKYDDLGDDISREFDTVRRIEVTNDLQLGAYKEDTITSIKEKVDKGIRSDKSMTEVQDDIAKINSRSAFYAETLARTSLMRYGRVSKYEKALLADVNIFAYLGILRDTTRPFCRALLNGRYKLEDIQQFRNGNLEPVIHNCGGWNCIHDWEPDPTATEDDVVSGELIYLDEDPGARVIVNDPTNLAA